MTEKEELDAICSESSLRSSADTKTDALLAISEDFIRRDERT